MTSNKGDSGIPNFTISHPEEIRVCVQQESYMRMFLESLLLIVDSLKLLYQHFNTRMNKEIEITQ